MQMNKFNLILYAHMHADKIANYNYSTVYSHLAISSVAVNLVTLNLKYLI